MVFNRFFGFLLCLVVLFSANISRAAGEIAGNNCLTCFWNIAETLNPEMCKNNSGNSKIIDYIEDCIEVCFRQDIETGRYLRRTMREYCGWYTDTATKSGDNTKNSLSSNALTTSAE